MVTPSGLVVLTDRRSARGSLFEVVRQAVRGGAAWVVLRERDLPYAQRRALAERLREVAPLIVAGPDALGGDAVHLAARDPMPSPRPALVGRSCHTAAEVAAASDVDYVMVSPVYLTGSKPGYGPALTPSGAARLAGGRNWLALGGITRAAEARACAEAGATGVAVMGAMMKAAEPQQLARELALSFRRAGLRRHPHPVHWVGSNVAGGYDGFGRLSTARGGAA